MAGTLQNVFGGMLEGVGTGLAQSGADDRAAAMEVLKQKNAMTLLQTEYGFKSQDNIQNEGFRQADLATEGKNQLANTAAAGQNDLANIGAQGKNSLATVAAEGKNQRGVEAMREGFEGGQLKDLQVDGSGNVIGITTTGKTINTGITSGALNKQDQDALDLLKTTHTTKSVVADPDNPGSKKTVEAIDTAGLASALAGSGRPALVSLANSLAPKAMTSTPQSFGGKSVDLSSATPTALNNSVTTTGTAPGSSPSGAGAIPTPPAFLGKPDGTVLSKGGTNYVKQGTQLIPQSQ